MAYIVARCIMTCVMTLHCLSKCLLWEKICPKRQAHVQGQSEFILRLYAVSLTLWKLISLLQTCIYLSFPFLTKLACFTCCKWFMDCCLTSKS